MERIGIYGKLKIEERNGVLTAKFRKSMKYGKLNNETLDIKEVENGMEVGGSLTEQQIIEQGYKPVCEVEKPTDASFCVYKEYDACFVQIWKREGEEIQEDEIWTSDSGIMPKYSDFERLTRDLAMVTKNINSIDLTGSESLSIKALYPQWSDFIGQSLKANFKINHNEKLYKTLQEITTVLDQDGYRPGEVGSEALYAEINEADEGTIDNPIPYNNNMELLEDKYYSQGGVTYRCTRDTGQPVYQDLSALVGIYVEKA